MTTDLTKKEIAGLEKDLKIKMKKYCKFLISLTEKVVKGKGEPIQPEITNYISALEEKIERLTGIKTESNLNKILKYR